ncbi:phage tail length tape measure family protein [Pararhizobium gei]|uniref:phage tail length tape measure family protein n=1 Tax=Pararhizobium gei TaxID=1395951 RepID=UPI0023DAD0FC|nr:phage tail length tape measure family protein [Rhizobium gei]
MTVNLDMVFRADASAVKPAAEIVKREMDGVTAEVTEATAALGKHATALERDADASRNAAEAARQERAVRERINQATLARPSSLPTSVPASSPYSSPSSYPVPNGPMPAANDNEAQYRRQNAGYQYFDIGQSLAGGMPLGMIAAQQGPQLLQIYAGSGGVNAALKDFMSIAGAAARVVGPLAVAVTAGYGAYKLLASYSVEAGLAVSETTRALAEQASPLGTLQGLMGDLTSLQETYNSSIRAGADASSAATSIIIANSEREYRAKQSLLELEQKRLQASIEVQRSELAIAQHQLKSDLSATVNTRLDLGRTGYGDERVGRFVALPDDMTGLDKTRDLLDRNPLTDKIKELRANLELTEIGARKLTEAVSKTFSADPYGKGDLPIIGPVPEARPNIEMEGLPGEVKSNEATGRSYRDVIQSAQERIAQMRLEASASGATGIAAQRLRFELDLLQEVQNKGHRASPEQRREIERLGEAYANAASQAARMKIGADAQFEREQIGRPEPEQRIASQLRNAGLPVDLSSYEASILRSNESLREQVKVWEEIRDVGRSAIDDLSDSALNGFEDIESTFKDIGKNILGELNTLAIKNPIKNAIYGDGGTFVIVEGNDQ